MHEKGLLLCQSFLETFRLVNDLVLWEPSSPLLKKSLAGQPGVNIAAPFGDSAFQLCRPSARRGPIQIRIKFFKKRV